MQDAHGRTITVTEDERGVTYALPGYEVSFPQANDARAIELCSMFDAPPPVKSPEQLQAEIVEAVQQRLDAFARTRGYDGILSACSYAVSTVPKFHNEGIYCVEARDATWAALYSVLAEVQAGDWPTAGAGQVPSGYEDVTPDLPLLEWPA